MENACECSVYLVGKSDACSEIKAMMKTLVLLITSLFLFPVLSFGHGDISKLPSSVQVLQYKMALYMNADDLDTRNKLALAYFATGQIDQAEKELKIVLAKDSNNFDALDEMGLVLYRKGDMQGALRYFERAGKINPHDMMLHVHTYVVCRELHQDKRADEELARAQALATGEEDRKRIEKEIGLLTTAPEKSR